MELELDLFLAEEHHYDSSQQLEVVLLLLVVQSMCVRRHVERVIQEVALAQVAVDKELCLLVWLVHNLVVALVVRVYNHALEQLPHRLNGYVVAQVAQQVSRVGGVRQVHQQLVHEFVGPCFVRRLGLL